MIISVNSSFRVNLTSGELILHCLTATIGSAYSHSLTDGFHFWDPSGGSITSVSVIGQPAWLTVAESSPGSGVWELSGNPTETSATEHSFELRIAIGAEEASRIVQLEVGGNPLGDFDADGDVDLVDLDRYNGSIGIAANGALNVFDLNNDGTIGADDFAQHYETLVETSNGRKGTFAGDINLDGTVDVLSDAFVLIGNLNNSATSWGQGDLNADGVIDVLSDAFALIANLGNSNE